MCWIGLAWIGLAHQLSIAGVCISITAWPSACGCAFNWWCPLLIRGIWPWKHSRGAGTNRQKGEKRLRQWERERERVRQNVFKACFLSLILWLKRHQMTCFDEFLLVFNMKSCKISFPGGCSVRKWPSISNKLGVSSSQCSEGQAADKLTQHRASVRSEQSNRLTTCDQILCCCEEIPSHRFGKFSRRDGNDRDDAEWWQSPPDVSAAHLEVGSVRFGPTLRRSITGAAQRTSVR